MNIMEIPESIISQIDKIKQDTSSGANELALKAVHIIQNQLNLIEKSNMDLKQLIYHLAHKIIRARPSMAPLINSIGFIITSTDKFTKQSLMDVISSYFELQTRKKSILELNFKKFLTKMEFSEPRIMLISYSSTVLNLLLKNENIPFIVYVLESRPKLEGRKVAQELSEKFETHLIVDAAMGKFINEIDMIFIGIDSILRDGSIINKIGTYPLSVLAKINKKPVYAIGDTFKYNLRSHLELPVEIVKKPRNEILDDYNPNLYIENYYFDITPPEYIEGIISDLGVISIPNFLKEIEKNLPISWFKKFL
jgi:translation initiation factor 2B subunit (eIF-2B alpha/beta/delta family)